MNQKDLNEEILSILIFFINVLCHENMLEKHDFSKRYPITLKSWYVSHLVLTWSFREKIVACSQTHTALYFSKGLTKVSLILWLPPGQRKRGRLPGWSSHTGLTPKSKRSFFFFFFWCLHNKRPQKHWLTNCFSCKNKALIWRGPSQTAGPSYHTARWNRTNG